jgi:hypothetical protein
MENLLLDYMLDPEMVHEIARRVTDHCLKTVDIAFKKGADFIISCNECGGDACVLVPFVYSASWPWRERYARLLVGRPGGGASDGSAVGERKARRDSGRRVL